MCVVCGGVRACVRVWVTLTNPKHTSQPQTRTLKGKNYCPRMASMNKPAYAATQVHAREKPVLVFVASRRQTRLTALDLISYAAADERPEQWLHMTAEEMQVCVLCVWGGVF